MNLQIIASLLDQLIVCEVCSGSEWICRWPAVYVLNRIGEDVAPWETPAAIGVSDKISDPTFVKK